MNNCLKNAVDLLSVLLDTFILLSPLVVIHWTSPTTRNYLIGGACMVLYFILCARGYSIQGAAQWLIQRIQDGAARRATETPTSDEMVEVAVVSSRFDQAFMETPPERPAHGLPVPPNLNQGCTIHSDRGMTRNNSLRNSFTSQQDIFCHEPPTETRSRPERSNASTCDHDPNGELPMNPHNLIAKTVHFRSTSDVIPTAAQETDLPFASRPKCVNCIDGDEVASSDSCLPNSEDDHETDSSRTDYSTATTDYENFPKKTKAINHKPAPAMQVIPVSCGSDCEIEAERHASPISNEVDSAFKDYPIVRSDYTSKRAAYEVASYTEQPLWSGAYQSIPSLGECNTFSIDATLATQVSSLAESTDRKLPRQNCSQVFFFEADHLMLDTNLDAETTEDQHFSKVPSHSFKENGETVNSYGSRIVDKSVESKSHGRRANHLFIPDTPSKKAVKKMAKACTDCEEDCQCEDNCIDLCDFVATEFEARGTSSTEQPIYLQESDSSRASKLKSGKAGKPLTEIAMHTGNTGLVPAKASDYFTTDREVEMLDEKSSVSILYSDKNKPETKQPRQVTSQLAYYSKVIKESHLQSEGKTYRHETEKDALQHFEKTKLTEIPEVFDTELETNLLKLARTGCANSNYKRGRPDSSEQNTSFTQEIYNNYESYKERRKLIRGKILARAARAYESDSSLEYDQHSKEDNSSAYHSASTQTDQSESEREIRQPESTEPNQSDSNRQASQSETARDVRQSESDAGSDQSAPTTSYEGDEESGSDDVHMNLHVNGNGDVRGCLHCVIKDRMTKTRNIVLAYLLKNMQDVYHLYDIRDREAVYRRDVTGLDRRIRVKVDAVRRITQIQKTELVEMVKTHEVMSEILQVVENLDSRFSTDTEDTESSICSLDASQSICSSSTTTSPRSYRSNNETYTIESSDSSTGSSSSSSSSRRRSRM